MRKFNLVLLSLLVCAHVFIVQSTKVSAANGDKMWSVNYGGTSSESALDIIEAPGGGYMAVGTTNSTDYDITTPSLGGNDFLLAKIDINGNKEWIKTFGGSLADILNSITLANDNTYIIAGNSNSANGIFSEPKGGNDAVLAKINTSGDLIWLKTFGGSTADTLIYAEQASDGFIYAVGTSMSSNGDIVENKGLTDIMIAKYDTNGNKIWVKTYGSSAIDAPYSAKVLPGGGIVMVGASMGSNGDIVSNKGSNDSFIVKFDSDGNKVWIKSYGGTQSDYFYEVVLTSDGGYAVSGASASKDNDFAGEIVRGPGSNDFVIMKLDSNGNKMWLKTYGGSGSDILKGLVNTSDGGYAAAGYSNSSDYDVPTSKGSFDFVLLKVDATGVLKWIRTYGGPGNDTVSKLYRDRLGNLVMPGITASSTGDFSFYGLQDAAIVKAEYVDKETRVLVGIVSGGMSLTVPTISSAFTGVTLNGTTQKTYANLSSFSVSDLTGTRAGWKVNVSATALQERAPDGTWDTEGTRLSLPVGSMKIASLSTITAVRGASPAPTAMLTAPTILDGAGSVSVISAAIGAGMDGYTISFQSNTLEITVGPEVEVDAIRYPASPTLYESTLTWSIVSGP